MHRGGVTPLPPRSELDAARAATACGARVAPAARRGATLLELLVVLLLLGLAAALVAPVLRLPADGGAGREGGRGAGTLALAADAARDAALRRGESVVLDVAPGGEWTVAPAVVAAAADTAPLLAGRLDVPPARALRVVVSPLGTCVPDVPAGVADTRPAVADAVWDAGTCRPAGAAAATR